MADRATVLRGYIARYDRYIANFAAAAKVHPLTAAQQHNLAIDVASRQRYADELEALTNPSIPAEPVTADLFVDFGGGGDQPYIFGGSPDNPNGVTFTFRDAIRWWTEVFTQGVNIGRVRPTLLPGSIVLSQKGYRRAVTQNATSKNYAPEDYNPLGLAVVP